MGVLPGAAGLLKEPPAEVVPKRFVMLPLVVERNPVFGALQIESLHPLDELELGFVSAVVNQLAVALDRLRDQQPRPLDSVIGGAHQQGVVDPCRFEKFEGQFGDHEGHRLVVFQQRRVTRAGQPQEVRPPALEIANVVGVIDHPGEVGVLVIDPQRQQVRPALEAAGGGLIGHAAGGSRVKSRGVSAAGRQLRSTGADGSRRKSRAILRVQGLALITPWVPLVTMTTWLLA
mgnify:CR=1 FL=1